MIKVTSLKCGYAQTVLQNLNLTSTKNLVVLGANGAGKSTLAKALCGLLPYDGAISINGTSLQSITPQQRAQTITYIPPKLESYDTYITVLAFVLMGRHPYKAPFESYSQEDEDLAHKLIQAQNLDPNKNIGELSSGQQQLLLITQALAQESKIIIFDEPTANLDPQHSVAFYQALQGLKNVTQKIIITHDLNLAHKLGYEVLFIQEGTATHYTDPRSFFTTETLQKAYGVNFTLKNNTVEVLYD